ncbi:MAG: hypothetical protein DRG87_07460 [Deltaproteobacteria bacterium]|nr:hypothetical protein [Deltaproteobacteria bacterium]MBW2311096.1 hypothetical protein [Deltaproteobacteria bacterium]RLB29288.1 MAG: hypothetical protein DRG87_07460 [Deltaproteobacteria bacterium]
MVTMTQLPDEKTYVQFRVDVPGGKTFIAPDIVLFVNGIPLVVAECKSPNITNPMEEGINQLLRYSNQRHEVEEEEGSERLFYYNQCMIRWKAGRSSSSADTRSFGPCIRPSSG